ncbi:protein LMBR1L isoform 3-T3 [Morphnus guianensis]
MLRAALPPPGPLVWVFSPPQCMMTRMLLSTGLRKFLPILLPACGMLCCFLSLPRQDAGSPQPVGVGGPGGCDWVVTPVGAQTQRRSRCSALPQAGTVHLHPGCGAGRRPPAALLHHQQRGAALVPPELLHPVAERVPCPRWVRGVASRCPEGCGSGLPPGSSPHTVPPSRPLELGLPLLQSVPRLPHALCLLLHRVGGLCRIQEGHHGQGVRDVGGAAAADTAGAGHGLGGLRHRQQQCGQPPVALWWVLSGCTGALLAPAGQDQTLVLKGRRDARCCWSDPAVSADLWEYYLPYLYSCISLFGVLLLLLCTPFGLSTMFTVTGKLLVKPRVRCRPPPGSHCPSLGACGPRGCLVCHPAHGVAFTAAHGLLAHPQLLEDLDEQLSCTRLEEAAVSRRISSGGCPARLLARSGGGSGQTGVPSAPPHGSPQPPRAPRCLFPGRQSFLLAELERGAAARAVLRHPEQEAEAGAAAPSVALAEEPGLPPGHAGPPGADGECPSRGSWGSSLSPSPTALTPSLLLPGHLRAHRLLPRPGAAAGRCCDATGHPGTWVGEQGTARSCVPCWPGDRSPTTCPLLSRQDASLGQVSFSIFGSFGAALQVVLIFYLMVSSVVGFYSSPLFTRLLPEWQDTPLTKIIGNCVSLLVLSSALPVFSRTLGITRFDLLGDFGRFNWLGNFYIVFLYNMGFAGLTTLCLVKKVSWAVQAELICAFGLHKLPLPVTRSRPLGKPC